MDTTIVTVEMLIYCKTIESDRIPPVFTANSFFSAVIVACLMINFTAHISETYGGEAVTSSSSDTGTNNDSLISYFPWFQFCEMVLSLKRDVKKVKRAGDVGLAREVGGLEGDGYVGIESCQKLPFSCVCREVGDFFCPFSLARSLMSPRGCQVSTSRGGERERTTAAVSLRETRRRQERQWRLDSTLLIC